MKFSTAIRALRNARSESQQAFANALRLSVRAVANYEAGRTPTLSVLFTLAMTAGKSGQNELAEFFSAEYARRLKGSIEPVTDDEKAWVRLMLAIIRNREAVPDWTQLSTLAISAI